ncbi:MAG: DUF4873 domain-containing protein [Micromonosporaceae bacterium]
MTDQDDYQGDATLLVADTEIQLEVTLRGFFQPIDGRFHWYGRLTPDERLEQIAQGGKRAVLLRTRHREVEAEVSDPDPWGRYRIMGVGTPPYPAPETPLET